MAQKKINYKQILENNPVIILGGVFLSGFIICSSILQFYYSDKIQDIKEKYDFRLEEQIKDCNTQINFKVLEIQQQEREKYYQKIDENSVNGKLLEKILEYNDMKGGTNEK